MFKVTVQTNFWASHQLTLPDGEKETIHSHNWIVTADIGGEKLNRMGLLIDFNKLKKLLDNITDKFTNQLLEDNEFFQKQNSSAEMLAKYIFEKLQYQLPKHLALNAITVTEEPGCSGTFTKIS